MARDRGSILVLALLAAAAASIAGMWLILQSDLRSRSSRFLAVASVASRVAVGGLQSARIQLDKNMGWSGSTVNSPYPDMPGSIRTSAAPTGWATAHASTTATVGSAVQSVHADLRAVIHPTLAFNFDSETTVSLDDATLAGRIRANGNVTATGNVDYSGDVVTLTGSTVSSQINPNQVSFDPAALHRPAVNVATYQSLASPLMLVPRQGSSYVLQNLSWDPLESTCRHASLSIL